MSRIDFTCQLQLQDLHTCASKVCTICMCMKTAETARKPQTLPLAPKSDKHIHAELYENLSFCLQTCSQTGATTAFHKGLFPCLSFGLSVNTCHLLQCHHYPALTQCSQRNFRAFYKGCQYCYCSFMTVKIRHRVHLSLKKMKNTMENVFFGGKAHYSMTQKCIK